MARRSKKCSLCDARTAKRHCPAKSATICSVCCGTKREVEIDCPSDCVHLRKCRSYEAERGAQQGPVSDNRRFDERFLYQNAQLIATVAEAVLEERAGSTSMVDRDATEAFSALIATLKTLSTGLYYETLPEGGPVASALFRRIKSLLDELMKPPEVPGRRALRVSEAQEVLDFMIQTSDFHSSGRPKSRRYLDWLRTMVPEAPEQEQSRLIVP